MNPDESDKLLKTLQTIATGIVASTSTIAASGFVALHSHLSGYTHIPAVGVPFQFYIVAGVLLFIAVSFLILSMWGLSQIFKVEEWLGKKVKGENPSRHRSVAGLLVSALYLALCGFVLFRLFNIDDILEYIKTVLIFLIPYILLLVIYSRCVTDPKESTLGQRFRNYVDNPVLLFLNARKHIIAATALFLFLSWYSFIIAGAYGSSIYRSFPSFLSGGHPTDVTIIFREQEFGTEIGMPLLKNSPNQSEGVCLLIPLTEGPLVYDPKSKTTFSIPNDIILSVKDAKPNVPLDCNPPKP